MRNMDIDVDVLPLFRYDPTAEIRLRRAAAAWEHATIVIAHASEPNVYRVRLDAPSGDEVEIEVHGRLFCMFCNGHDLGV